MSRRVRSHASSRGLPGAWVASALALSAMSASAQEAWPPPEEGATPDESAAAPIEEQAVPEEGGAAPSNPAAVDQLFAIIRDEPSIRDVQRDALRHYRLEPERIHGMVRNARLKGLLPDLEGSFDTTRGNQFNNTADGLFPALPVTTNNPRGFKEASQGENSSQTFRVRVIFNLDRLVFNSEALDAKSLNSLGENLVREVTTLYFSRRRLLASLILNPPQSDAELYYELMRLDELTSTLDALTGGRFAEHAWQWNQNDEAAADGEEGGGVNGREARGRRRSSR